MKPAVLENTERGRVLSQAVAEASKRLKVSSSDLGAILGFSQPTSSRLLNQKYAVPEGSKAWELSAHFVRMYRSLSSLVGGDDTLAKKWLTSPNSAFNEQTPLQYIKRIDGLIHVCEYLDAHRATV